MIKDPENVEAAARLLGISPEAVRSRIQKGDIEVVYRDDSDRYDFYEEGSLLGSIAYAKDGSVIVEEKPPTKSPSGKDEPLSKTEEVRFYGNKQREDPVSPIEEPSRKTKGDEGSNRLRAGANRRLNVVFSESAYNTLKDLANQSGKTISEVVRDAIALQKWFIDTRRAGGRILVEERGRVREIINIR